MQGLATRCREQLERQGFAVLEAFLSSDELEELRLEADTLYELAQEGQHLASPATSQSGGATTTARWGADAISSCIYETLPGPHCTPLLRTDPSAYQALRTRWPLRAGVWHLLFHSRLTQLVIALLGSQAVLYNDQYIVKPPPVVGPTTPSSTAFRWHRDSDWCRSEEVAYQPYISVWCALDDMTAENGCLIVQPGTHRLAPLCQKRDAMEQQQQQQTVLERQNGPPLPRQQREERHAIPLPAPSPVEERRQQQAAPVMPLTVPAGSAIITTDAVLHCSGLNRSRHMRRAWMPQFSAAPLCWRATGRPVSLAIPLLPPRTQGAPVPS